MVVVNLTAMATPSRFDSARLMSWARRASDELNRRRVEINKLNVFPVPDSDTGSNMAHTMAAAVAEAERLPADADPRQVAEALAIGAVKGARGNSGVVLSQVMRGVAQSIAEDSPGGAMIADSLAAAVRFVDKAIADPVEGTVITVLRAAAVAAQEVSDAADNGNAEASIELVAQAATEAARIALANTPSQLEALRKAGVVDAGGMGLVVLLEALGEEVGARPFATSSNGEAVEAPTVSESHESQESHGTAGNLEVMFMFEGDVDSLEADLQGLGDSLIVARADDRSAKVHIHSTDAGRVIERAFAAGAVTQLRLEILPAAPVTAMPQRLILAITPPGSLTELYRQAGAEPVAPGDNVVAELLAAIRRAEASEVVLLPNGLLDQRQLAAVEKAARAFEQSVTLLPTVRLVSGLAALSVHDPNQPLATAAFAMAEAASEMRTAVCHRAPRAGLIQGGAVAKGDVVVTARGELVLIADEALEAITSTCHRLLSHGGEQVTIFFDPDEVAEESLFNLASVVGVEVFAFPADKLGAIAEIGVE